MKKILFLLGIFFLSITISIAQNTIIKGFTYDDANGENLPYCSVQLVGTSYGALSDSKGAFIINKIPKGTYTVKVSYLGYSDIYDTIVVRRDTTFTKRYLLKPLSTQLDAVQIVGEGQRKEQETRTSVISVTPKDMSKMPSIGGQPDFAQYLQVLPGIVSTGAQGGQIYVRGGTPIQNMLLLDGVILYSPFHSIGIFSVFDMDIMSLYDFIKQMKLICDIKHNIQTINKLDDYKKEILEKDIEYYIEHGKKMSINSKIKLSMNKFYYNLILAFILFIVCMFLLSFVN